MTADVDDTFDDVFARDSRDSGADIAAPVSEGPLRDEAGRFAAKPGPEAVAKEPETVSEVPKPEPTAVPEKPAEAAPTEPKSHQVPLSELLGEREKRKSEAKLREEAEARAREIETRFQALERQFQQSQQPRTEPPKPPDPFADPAGAYAYQQSQLEQRLLNQRADVSEMIARQKHGDAVVEAAMQAVAARPEIAGRFLGERDPYGALLAWHKQEQFMSRVKGDPEAYEQSLREQITAEVLAGLKAGTISQPTAAPAVTATSAPKFPTSLASATPAGDQGAILTDERIAADLFDTNRRQRRFA